MRKVLTAGYAAATILPQATRENRSGQLRIAFDGDAVIFSDEAERVYKTQGLEAFSLQRARGGARPLRAGPFKAVLEAIHKIQSAYPADENPMRTALVTARSAPAHKRVILTLRAWGIRIDESMFLGGREKASFPARVRRRHLFRRPAAALRQCTVSSSPPVTSRTGCQRDRGPDSEGP